MRRCPRIAPGTSCAARGVIGEPKKGRRVGVRRGEARWERSHLSRLCQNVAGPDDHGQAGSALSARNCVDAAPPCQHAGVASARRRRAPFASRGRRRTAGRLPGRTGPGRRVRRSAVPSAGACPLAFAQLARLWLARRLAKPELWRPPQEGRPQGDAAQHGRHRTRRRRTATKEEGQAEPLVRRVQGARPPRGFRVPMAATTR